MACCDTNKKNHKIFNFTDPKFFESAEISVVVQFAANKKLFKDRLAGRENKHYIIVYQVNEQVCLLRLCFEKCNKVIISCRTH